MSMTVSPHLDKLILMPVRRKKVRPSFSPVKIRVKHEHEQKRSHSEGPPNPPLETLQSTYDSATAALDFKEFSFWRPDGSLDYNQISKEHMSALQIYLSDNYNAICLDFGKLFMTITCEPDVPAEDKRPFSIAGMIAVWRTVEQGGFFTSDVGVAGNNDDALPPLPPHISEDLRAPGLPKPESLHYIAENLFADCDAVSYVWDTVDIELPLTTMEQFRVRLNSLPRYFDDNCASLFYHNGPLAVTEYGRDIKPDPTYADDRTVEDNTDYVEARSCFWPGAQLNSWGWQKKCVPDGEGKLMKIDEEVCIGVVTANVEIQKGSEKRLIVPYHCWQPLAEDEIALGHGKQLGDPSFCHVYQGNPENGEGKGTQVGYIEERIGSTDFALVKLGPDIAFSNRFMEMDYAAKRMLSTGEVGLADEFLIDSFVTGKQRLRCAGSRLPKVPKSKARSKPDPLGPAKLLPPDDNAYIKLMQGIYAVNEPIITTKPQIREGVCGAVLLRCKIRQDATSMDEVLKAGEVAGMMHYSNLRPKTISTENLLCFADAFDPLIEAGWQIVPVSEKHSVGSKDDDSDDKEDGIPRSAKKRQRK